MSKGSNAEKGKQGFQETTTGKTAPTSKISNVRNLKRKDIEIVTEKGRVTIILCHKHFIEYAAKRSSSIAGSMYYAMNTAHPSRWTYFRYKEELYCRECRKTS